MQNKRNLCLNDNWLNDIRVTQFYQLKMVMNSLWVLSDIVDAIHCDMHVYHVMNQFSLYLQIIIHYAYGYHKSFYVYVFENIILIGTVTKI